MNCRSCRGASLTEVIDLGPMPLVNNLLSHPDQPCPRWPLQVVFCTGCGLAQLREAPPPQKMFDHYRYFSSQSQTMVAHARRLVERFVSPGQRLLEIGSNDGYLLRQALERGARVLGIDPARNIAQYANESSVPTRSAYFNEDEARDIALEWGQADVIFALNVLAHVPDPNVIAAGIKMVLAKDGIAHIEVPYFRSMIALGAFDTIYHEHHSYFTVAALKRLFNKHGLRMIDVQLEPVHGGSLHIQLDHRGGESRAEAMVEDERRAGLIDAALLAGFSQRVTRLKDRLLGALDQFDSIAAFGAAAKGVILLNVFGLDRSIVRWVADVSPHKQGRYIPGTRQPIVAPQMLLDERPEVVLLLPWNIREEIVRRNQAYLNQGGRFIVPIPEVEVL